MQEVFEKIIEKLEKLADELYKSYCIGFNSDDRAEYDAYINAIEIVKQEAEKYNNGWIPVDGVYFPKENVYVRVTIWNETEMIGFRRDGKWFVYGSDGMAEATVLAWQPTQPYHPKGE